MGVCCLSLAHGILLLARLQINGWIVIGFIVRLYGLVNWVGTLLFNIICSPKSWTVHHYEWKTSQKRFNLTTILLQSTACQKS